MKTLLCVMLLGAICACSSKPDLTCSTIHEPKPGAGCPSGYVKEKRPRFTERDGSKEYACVSIDPNKSSCMDVLRSGETVAVTLEEMSPKEKP
jgi:hypothetical protein